MSRLYRAVVGLALIAVGMLKLQSVAYQAGQITMPTCLGGTITLNLGAQSYPLLHCWGCYAAVIGAIFLLTSLAKTQQVRRSIFSRG